MLSNTLSIIKYRAFAQCSQIENITIPTSVTTISKEAFAGCSKLAEVTFEDTEHWSVKTDDGSIIKIPSSDLEDPAKAAEYLRNTYANCSWSKAIGSYTLNSDGKGYTLTGGIDEEEGKLWTLQIPSEYMGLPVTAIGEEALYMKDWLTSVIIPDSVTRIGTRAFSYCGNLTNVTIGNCVDSLDIGEIGESAFEGCDNLTSIIIPDGIGIIGERAFKNCTGLTRVEIGEGILTISDEAFDGCNSLEVVHIKSICAPYLGDDAFGLIHNATLVVPIEAMQSYNNVVDWSHYFIIEYSDEVLT